MEIVLLGISLACLCVSLYYLRQSNKYAQEYRHLRTIRSEMMDEFLKRHVDSIADEVLRNNAAVKAMTKRVP